MAALGRVVANTEQLPRRDQTEAIPHLWPGSRRRESRHQLKYLDQSWVVGQLVGVVSGLTSNVKTLISPVSGLASSVSLLRHTKSVYGAYKCTWTAYKCLVFVLHCL